MADNVSKTSFEMDVSKAVRDLNSLIDRVNVFQSLTSKNFGGNIDISNFKRANNDLGKSVDSLKSQTIKSNNDILKSNQQTEKERLAYSKQANADILRMKRENAKAELEIDRQLIRQQKAEQIAKINEVKRLNLSAINDLKQKPTASNNLGGNTALNAVIGAVSTYSVMSTLNDLIQKSFELEKANRLLSASATEAGLSYQKLSDINKTFAADSGLSRSNASSLTARITQLATNAGMPDNVQKLQKGFLDLSSARGISNSDLDTLIGTILSGQDEGLNKLGLDDPSKLQESYATSLGKTAKQLTQVEKTQAAVNAVMEKAGIFTGANADRLNSLSGQAETASARIDDLKTNLGRSITNTLEFREALKLTSDVLKLISTDVDQVQKRLAEGVTPKQLAEEQANSWTAKTMDAWKNASAVLPATLAYPYDLLKNGFEDANRQYLEAIKNAKNRRVDALEDMFEAGRRVIENQKRAALEQKQFTSINNFLQSDKERVKFYFDDIKEKREDLLKNLSYGNPDDVSSNNSKINQLKTNRHLFTDIDQYNDKVGDFLRKNEQLIERGKEKVKELGKTWNSTFNDLFGKTGASNPIFTVMNEGNQALEKLKENLKTIPKEFEHLKQQAFSMQNALNDSLKFGVTLDNKLEAMDLRDKAEDFRNYKKKDFEITDQNKFFTDYIDFQTKKFQQGQELGTQYHSNIYQDEKGKWVTNGFSQSRETPFTEYHSNIYQDEKGKWVTNGFSQSNYNPMIGYNANVYQDEKGKWVTNGFSQYQKTFEDLTQSEKQNYLSEINKKDLQENLTFQNRLNMRIDAVKLSNPADDLQRNEANRRLISLAQNTDISKLTDSQRNVIADAFDERAKRTESYQKTANELLQKQIDAQNETNRIQREWLEIAKNGGINEVNIKIEKDMLANVTEGRNTAPTRKDTEDGYRPN